MRFEWWRHDDGRPDVRVLVNADEWTDEQLLKTNRFIPTEEA